ncbi:MAG: hypothetical protein H6510_15090 [Acidobacteria bacterium]|nr:hypothetical protein [Acidobacteriota bacterium]MCB9399139.1 hypothetical protein [Acidobacteriota bacterium]
MFFLLTWVLLQTGRESLPKGEPVLINGFLAENEWADAWAQTYGPLQIRAKLCGPYLLLAVWEPGVVHTGLDLYMAEDPAKPRKFHVSSALCEAHLMPDGSWSEKWENNRGWVANKIGLFQLDGARQTSQPEAFEFQFDRSLFAGTQIYLAVHLKRPETEWPGDRSQTDQWFVLQLPANPQD